MDSPPRASLSFGRFLRDVLVAAALLAGGFLLYEDYAATRNLVKRAMVSGQRDLKQHDLASLDRAEAVYKNVLEKDNDNEEALTCLAELYIHHLAHGLDTLESAEHHLALAKAAGATSSARYAVEAYVDVARGESEKAETEIKKLLDDASASPKLAHAYGWALMKQGKLTKAKRVLRQAIESDFSAIAYRLTLTEISARQGDERAAAKQLHTIVKKSMNSNHNLAWAWLAALQAKNYGELTEPASHIERVRKAKQIAPRTSAFLKWAEGELSLAMGHAEDALQKADEALGIQAGYPPLLELKARALLAHGTKDAGLAAYRTAALAKPEYLGIKWALARVLSELNDDAALTLMDELEKRAGSDRGPEFELFRSQHYLRNARPKEAKAALARAAELGRNAAVLLGEAQIAFAEEQQRGNKANLERVAEAFQLTLERKPIYPEAHQAMAKISLWNLNVDSATRSFARAESQYRELSRSIPELVRFYDDTINHFERVQTGRIKNEARTAAKAWKAKKQQFLKRVLGN